MCRGREVEKDLAARLTHKKNLCSYWARAWSAVRFIDCGKFAKLFSQLNDYLESARIQGFCWDESHDSKVKLLLDETAYLTLALRYKELYQGESGSGGAGIDDVPFDLSGHLNEIDTGKIDADYMNTRFDKYLKLLQTRAEDAGDDALKSAVDELHKSFAC